MGGRPNQHSKLILWLSLCPTEIQPACKTTFKFVPVTGRYMLNLTSAQLLYLVVFIQLKSIPTPSIQTIIREAQSYQKSIWFLLLINDLGTRLRSGTQQEVRELFILDGAALTSITEISSDVSLLSGKWNLVNPGIQRLKFLFAQVSHQNHLGINRKNRPKSETRADSTILLSSSVPSAHSVI